MPTAYPEIFARLAEKLPPEAIRQKKGRGGETLTYMTARGVMNRFDDVLGPENWRERYRQTPDGELCCWITIRLPDGSRITKTDVGIGQGNDVGTKRKAIYSDALKRAAVKFGVGRYLYRDGMPGYVREYLGLDKAGGKKAPAPPREQRPEPEPRTPAQAEAPAQTKAPAQAEPPSRTSINGDFKPAGAEPARPAHDKEKVKLHGDRIGARGLDTRNWITVAEQETERAIQKATGHRVRAGIGTESLDFNGIQVIRHMIKEAVAAGADGNPEPIGENGKPTRVGIGKLNAWLHALYLDPGWREWARRELKLYLKALIREDAEKADAEAAAGRHPAEDEDQDRGQLVGAANGEAWAPGRE